MILFMFAVLGLALGSFTNALVWRIYKQSKNKKSKQRDEYSIMKGRSMCTSCGHQLSAADLVPVLSWTALKGKCRYCKKPISWQYPAVELLTAALFVVSYLFWPFNLNSAQDYVLLALWLVTVVAEVAMTLYDLKWMILPNRLVYPTGGLAVAFTITRFLITGDIQVLLNALIGSVVFGGFFYGMYQISRGKWIGGGDVRLGFVLGILLGWQKSLLCLSFAAYLGTLLILVLVVLKKYHRKLKVPFGPFLLVAAFIVMLFGQYFIDWYLRINGLR